MTLKVSLATLRFERMPNVRKSMNQEGKNQHELEKRTGCKALTNDQYVQTWYKRRDRSSSHPCT